MINELNVEKLKNPQHLVFTRSLGSRLWPRPVEAWLALNQTPGSTSIMLKLSPPDPAWPPGLLDPPQTFDLSPMGSVRPGSGALRRRSSGGGPQGGGGGPSTSLEPGVEQEMPLGMQTSLERRKVNHFWDCTKKNCVKFFVFVKDIFLL